MALALSVLDQSPVPAGTSPAEALNETVVLAQAAERLGYRRFWVAEHHNSASLAGSSPEVLTAAVAARTSSIRVGSGGVMLSHYSPLKVAENFRMLDALFQGRVDLGVGRAAGTDPVAEAALQYRPGALGDEHFGAKLDDLLGFLSDGLDPSHPYASVHAVPSGPTEPELWLLGSSSDGAALAARLGLRFAFAHFISPAFGPRVVAGYRREFRESARLERPLATVAVSVICADTDAEAERLATSVDVWRLGSEGAGRGPLLAPEEAAARPLTELERALIAQKRASTFVGGPERVVPGLVELATSFAVDELVVVTVCPDLAARRRSYELLADAFGLYW